MIYHPVLSHEVPNPHNECSLLSVRDGRGEAMDDVGAPEILIDFPVRQGVKQVALTPADVARWSGDAVDSAMATIRAMAEKVAKAVDGLANRPDGMEVEFGLTFDAHVGALIAKSGVEAALTVRLIWSGTDQP